LSPDGRELVVRFDFQPWRRALDSPQLYALSGTTNARTPFWSPDSRYIGFFADGTLKTMSAGGGPPQSLCDAGLGAGGTWNSEGLILFGKEGGSIDRVPASGGSCAQVLKGDISKRYTDPVFLPDGRHFLYLARTPEATSSGLYVAALDDVPGRRLLPDLSSGIFASASSGGTRGNLVFLRENRVIESKPLPLLRSEFQESQATISSDGRWLAYASDESGQLEVYVRPFPSGSGKWQISNNGGREPRWRRDGTELFYAEFSGTRYNVMAVPVLGARDQRFEAGVPKPLFNFPALGIVPQGNIFLYSPTADGSRFLANVQVTDSRPMVNVITNWQQTIRTDER
jgi:hypothetical protein